jgi:hypothetical protein
VVERDDAEEGRDLALGEFAALWRRLAPPDPTAAVDAPDAATRELLDRLRAAWHSIGPASSAPPWTIRRRLALRRLVPRAAAAAALLLVAGLLLTPRARPPGLSRGDRIVGLPTATPAVPAAQEQVVRDAIPLVSLDAARMEFKRGPVRLILITPSPVARALPEDAEPPSAKEPK